MKNKKGFTLIELLATIVIIGVVLAISIVGVTSYLNKSEKKANLITRTSLLSSAQKYAKEYYDDDDWHQALEDKGNNSNIETACVNLEQLVGSGYLDEKKVSKFENDNRYLILKRYKDKKTIFDKHFATSDDVVFCKSTVPEINEEIKTYTNRIEANFLISGEVSANNEGGITRSISDESAIILKYNNSEYEYIINKKNFINQDDNSQNFKGEVENVDGGYKKINLEYNNLKNDVDYSITVKIIYILNEGKKNDIILEKNLDVNLPELKVPEIIVKNANEWTKQKNVEVKFDNENIYSELSSDKAYYQLKSTDTDIDVDLHDANVNLLSGENKRDLKINYKYDDSIGFEVKDNTTIEAILTDGTNIQRKTETINNIDNHNYECEITPEITATDKKLTLTLKDTTTPNNTINSDIVKEYKWGDNNTFTKYTGNNNIINIITVSKYGKYDATVKLRTSEKISCDTTIIEPGAPNLKIEVKKGDTTLTDTSTKWYNGTLTTTISTTDGEYVSYCRTTSTGTCSPEKQDTKSMTISLSKTGTYKIIGLSTGIDGKTTENSVIINIDNTDPKAPSSKVIKASDNSDVTDKFLKNSSWKDYKVKWNSFSATDEGSGTIEKYQYIEYHNKNTGTVTCDVATSDYGVKTFTKSEYTYENKDFVFCIRSVDKAGNTSDWTGPYYFRIDNEAPSIKLTFTSNGKSYTSKDWTSSDVKLTATTTKNGLSDVSSKCTIEEKTTDSYTNKQTKNFTNSLTHTLKTDSSLKYRIKCYAENAAGVKTYASGDDNNYNYVYIDKKPPSVKSLTLTSNGNTYTSKDWVNKDVSLSMSSTKNGLSVVTNVCQIYTKDVENQFSNNEYEFGRTTTSDSNLSYTFRNSTKYRLTCYAENAAGVKTYASGGDNKDYKYVYIDKVLPYFKPNESNFNKHGDYPWHEGGYYNNDTSLSVNNKSKVHRFGLCLQSIAKVSYGYKKKTDYDNSIPAGHRAITECSGNFVSLTVNDGNKARITGYTVESFIYEYRDSNNKVLFTESNNSYNASSGFYFGLSNESGYKNAKYVNVTIKVADPAGNTCARKFKVSFSKDGVNNTSEADIKAVSTSGYCIVDGKEVKVDDSNLKYRY